ncbi:MAG: hypothetical protein E6K96_07845 [Thaumarchaeota archaeon]|nr:MAG: hypothetical protein E6K96_07845 [Nitrososphaerota archaeon]
MARPPDSIHEDCGFLTFVFPPGGDVSLRRATELGSMALAFIGGGLIVTSGFTVHGFLLSLLSLVSGGLPTIVPAEIAIPLSITASVLSVLVALGGITVLLGGIALYRRHIFVGRFLIALGGGASFLGFLVTIGYAVVTEGVTSVEAHSQYWIGIVVAVLARWLAGKA